MTKHRTRNHPQLAYISFDMSLEDFDKWINKPRRVIMLPSHGEFDVSVTHDSFPSMIKILPESASLKFRSEAFRSHGNEHDTYVIVEISYPCRECGVVPFSSDEVSSVIVDRIRNVIGSRPELYFDEV